jgi:Mg2+-importing ATPase
MWLFGAISSAFDALTFWLLIHVLHAQAPLFRTAWFVESLATQVLVIFVIRTRGKPWASRPGAALSLASLFVVGAALLLPFSPLARFFHFEPPPAIFFAWLAGMLVAYLALAEMAKRFFYARLAAAAPSRTRGHPPRRKARA